MKVAWQPDLDYNLYKEHLVTYPLSCSNSDVVGVF